MLNIVIIILAVLVLVCLWIMIFDSNRFVVREYEFEDARIRKSCKAVVLADLHNKKYGKNNELLVEAIRKIQPDFILIAGDLLTAKPGAKLEIALNLLEELHEQFPIYYGMGNHEHRLQLYPEVYGDMGRCYEEALTKLGIQQLDNQKILLEEYGICVYGSKIDRAYYKRFQKNTMDESYLKQILGEVDSQWFSILLAHNPVYFEQYVKWGAPLVLAGHLHGGMVRIPFWGKGVVSPSIRLLPRYDGGLFFKEETSMVVSRGLGMHTIPIRLFNPGELVVLDLKNMS